jgi:Protein of unknown function (DUF3341)
MVERNAYRGVMGEFGSERAIIDAARALIEAGYRHIDAFVPRPIEELSDLITPQRSTLPRTVFFGGLFGALAGLGTEWFCNTWDSPLNVGGRPAFSLPAFIPIAFEVTVLFGSLTAFFGVLWRMRLPRLADPVFEVPNFESASIDRFWLYVSADDPRWRTQELEEKLAAHECLSVHWTRHELQPSAAGSPAPGRREELPT